MPYAMILYDQNWNIVDKLDNYTSIEYRKTINESDIISASIPREDIKIESLEIAGFVGIFENEKLKASGRISEIDVADEIVTIKGLTEEIALEQVLTPAQYGRVYDGMDLAEVARNCLFGYQTIRKITQEDWLDAVFIDNVDVLTEPGVVQLATDEHGEFQVFGNIIMRFSKEQITDFVSWERVRVLVDSMEDLSTTLQIRHGQTEEDMGDFGSELEGVYRDEVGFEIPDNAKNANFIDIRIIFYSPRLPVDEVEFGARTSPSMEVLELIARTEINLEEGDIPESTGLIVDGINADYQSGLRVLRDAVSLFDWEFTVVQNQLSIMQNIGQERTNEFVFHTNENIRVEVLRDDDADLVNVLTAKNDGDGINRLQFQIRNEESISKYGIYSKAINFRTDNMEDLQFLATGHLAQYSEPVRHFQITATFPIDDTPEFNVGDFVEVIDPRTDIKLTARILQEGRTITSMGVSFVLEINRVADELVRQAIDPAPVFRSIVSIPRATGLRGTSFPGGIVIRFAEPKSTEFQWNYSEIHVSELQGFTPRPTTLTESGKRTRFELAGLGFGIRFFVRAIHVDVLGNRSEPSEEFSITTGERDDIISRSATFIIASSTGTQDSRTGADLVCDGEHDQETIQEAVDSLPLEGGEIHLLEGRYFFSAPLVLKSGTNIKGLGDGTEITNMDGTSNFAFFTNDEVNAGQFNAEQQFTGDGFTRTFLVDNPPINRGSVTVELWVEGLGWSEVNENEFFVIDYPNGYVTFVVILDVGQQARIFYSFTPRDEFIRISNISIVADIERAQEGIAMSNLNSSIFSQIAFNGLSVGGFITNLHDSKFTDCTFLDCTRCIIYTTADFSVVNNNIMTRGTSGIIVRNSRNNYIQSNTASTFDIGIMIEHDWQFGLSERNHINDNNFIFCVNGLIASNMTTSHISNNQFTSSLQTALILSNDVVQTTIDGNRFDDSSLSSHQTYYHLLLDDGNNNLNSIINNVFTQTEGTSFPEASIRIDENNSENLVTNNDFVKGSLIFVSHVIDDGIDTSYMPGNKRAIPVASRLHNEPQTIPHAQFTILDLNTVIWDSGAQGRQSQFVVGEGRIVARQMGVYLIHGNIRWVADPTGDRILQIVAYDENENYLYAIAETTTVNPSNLYTTQMTASTTVVMKRGHYVVLRVLQRSGDDLDIMSTELISPRLTMTMLAEVMPEHVDNLPGFEYF